MNTFNQKTARVLLAAATICAAFATGARADEVAQKHVKYGDLKLDGAGAAVLYQRIKVAAMEVCGADGERELARRVRANACVDRAIAQAVAAVNAPALTGLYQNKMGGRTQLASIR